MFPGPLGGWQQVVNLMCWAGFVENVFNANLLKSILAHCWPHISECSNPYVGKTAFFSKWTLHTSAVRRLNVTTVMCHSNWRSTDSNTPWWPRLVWEASLGHFSHCGVFKILMALWLLCRIFSLLTLKILCGVFLCLTWSYKCSSKTKRLLNQILTLFVSPSHNEICAYWFIFIPVTWNLYKTLRETDLVSVQSTWRICTIKIPSMLSH